jgi:hypothetical protein
LLIGLDFMSTRPDLPIVERAAPLPAALHQAFREAVWRYADWSPPAPEIEIGIAGACVPMSAVCNLVVGCADRLPDDIIDRLMSYIGGIRYTLLRQKLIDQKTYAAGGRCFLRLIEDRKRQMGA